MQKQPEPIRSGGTLNLIYGFFLASLSLLAAIFTLLCLIVVIVTETTPTHTIPTFQGGIVFFALCFGGLSALMAFLLFFPARAQIRVGRKLRGNP